MLGRRSSNLKIIVIGATIAAGASKGANVFSDFLRRFLCCGKSIAHFFFYMSRSRIAARDWQ